MRRWNSFWNPGWFVFVGLLCAAGTWLYAERVLIPYQIADAQAHGRPRGNLSDLYPRWLGARELLLHGRDPYSAEVTREIQEGYFGRALNPARREDPTDQAGFAYPVYVAFLLAPTVGLPFAIVQKGFFWMLLLLTAASVWVWMRALRWAPTLAVQITALALTLGSLAVMQGLKLEQLSLLVAGLLAIAILLLSRGHTVWAGVLLAAGSIKPQLVLLLLVWLGIWTLADLRRRYQWAASFLVTMGVLFAASEWYLPHWLPRFVGALGEYKRYTGAMGVMEKLVGQAGGRVLEAMALAAMLGLCWRWRHHRENSDGFTTLAGLVLALTVLLAPTYAAYNQVLLLPALMLFVQHRRALWRKSLGSRVLGTVTAVLVLWPWMTSFVLAALSFVVPGPTVERAWAVPFWTSLLVPVGVAAMVLVYSRDERFGTSAEASTS